jgi:hypothetical protein
MSGPRREHRPGPSSGRSWGARKKTAAGRPPPCPVVIPRAFMSPGPLRQSGGQRYGGPRDQAAGIPASGCPLPWPFRQARSGHPWSPSGPGGGRPSGLTTPGRGAGQLPERGLAAVEHVPGRRPRPGRYPRAFQKSQQAWTGCAGGRPAGPAQPVAGAVPPGQGTVV